MDIKDRIIGTWTDSSTENASMDISKDSISYVDGLSAYSYNIDSDTITIEFGGDIYKSLVSWSRDTLIFTDQDGATAKFTRFKN